MLKLVTRRAPTTRELADCRFAWTVAKHTKSNAIVYAREGQTVGVGAGQMSRVDSVRIGAMRAQLPVAGDAFELMVDANQGWRTVPRCWSRWWLPRTGSTASMRTPRLRR